MLNANDDINPAPYHLEVNELWGRTPTRQRGPYVTKFYHRCPSTRSNNLLWRLMKRRSFVSSTTLYNLNGRVPLNRTGAITAQAETALP